MSFTVRVVCINDDDIERVEYGQGDAVQDAVDNAVDLARELSGDDTFTMSEWTAA